MTLGAIRAMANKAMAIRGTATVDGLPLGL
jgi:hypothetical protein